MARIRLAEKNIRQNHHYFRKYGQDSQHNQAGDDKGKYTLYHHVERQPEYGAGGEQVHAERRGGGADGPRSG